MVKAKTKTVITENFSKTKKTKKDKSDSSDSSSEEEEVKTQVKTKIKKIANGDSGKLVVL